MNTIDYLNEIKKIIINAKKVHLPESAVTLTAKLLTKYNREEHVGLFTPKGTSKKVTSAKLYQELFAMTSLDATVNKRMRMIFDRLILLTPTLKADDEIFSLMSALLSYYPKYLKYLKPIEHKFELSYSWLSEDVEGIQPQPLQQIAFNLEKRDMLMDVIAYIKKIGDEKSITLDITPYLNIATSQQISDFIAQLVNLLYGKNHEVDKYTISILFQICRFSLTHENNQKLVECLYQLELKIHQKINYRVSGYYDLLAMIFIKIKIRAQDAYNFLKIYLNDITTGTSALYNRWNHIPPLCRWLTPSQQNDMFNELCLKYSADYQTMLKSSSGHHYHYINNVFCYVMASILNVASADLKIKIIDFLLQLPQKNLINALFGARLGGGVEIERIDLGIRILFKNAIRVASDKQKERMERYIVTVLARDDELDMKSGLTRLPSFVMGVVSDELREQIIIWVLNQINQGNYLRDSHIEDLSVHIRYLSIEQKETLVTYLISMMKNYDVLVSAKFVGIKLLLDLMCTDISLMTLPQLFKRLNIELIFESEQGAGNTKEINRHWPYHYIVVQIVQKVLKNATLMNYLETSPVLGEMTTALIAVKLIKIEGYEHQFHSHRSLVLTCLKKLYLISPNDGKQKIEAAIKEMTYRSIVLPAENDSDDLLDINTLSIQEGVSLLTEYKMLGWSITAPYKAMVLRELTNALKELDPAVFPSEVRTLVTSYRF